MKFKEYVSSVLGKPLRDYEESILDEIEKADGKIEALGKDERKYGYAILQAYEEWKRGQKWI